MSALLIFIGVFLFAAGIIVYNGQPMAWIGLTTRKHGLIAFVVGIVLLTVGIMIQT